MSNEAEENINEEVVDESQEVELTELEAKIQRMGWNPKGSKSAAEWVADGYEKRGRKLSDLGKAVDSLKELTTKQEQLALDKARRELQEQKRDAITRGDVGYVEQIDKQTEQIMLQQQIQQHANQFVARNSYWYNDTSEDTYRIRQAAVYHDNIIANRRLSPELHFSEVEKQLKAEFPEHFDREKVAPRANAVEGGTPVVKSTKTGKSFTINDLNEMQKSACKRFERTNVMSAKEYIAALVASGDLK